MTTKRIVDTANAQTLLWGAGRAVCGLWSLIVALIWLILVVAGMATGYWVAVVAVPAIAAVLMAFVVGVVLPLVAAVLAMVVTVAFFVLMVAKLAVALALAYGALWTINQAAHWSPQWPTAQRPVLQPVGVAA